MKKTTILAILTVLALLLSGGTALAKKMDFTFDLVDIDVKYLEEADGRITFTVDMPDSKDSARIWQKMRDAAKPNLEKRKDALEDAIKKVNNRLEGKDPESKEAQKIIKELNDVYKQAIKEGQKMAQKDMEKELADMAKKNKELKKWKLKYAFSAVKRLFSIIKTAVKTALKPDPTTVTYIKGVASVLGDLYGIGKDMYTLFKSEGSARKDLAKKLAAMEKRLVKTVGKGMKTTKWQDAKTMMGFDPLDELEKSLAVYTQKNTAADKKADDYGAKVQELVTKQDDLSDQLKKDKNLQKDPKAKEAVEDAMTKSEQALAKTLASIDKINDSIDKGNKLSDQAKSLILIGNENTTTALDIKRAIDATQQALSDVKSFDLKGAMKSLQDARKGWAKVAKRIK